MNDTVYFFKCSVSEDLYGASSDSSGSLLPTPGGGKWLPLNEKSDLGDAEPGYDEGSSKKDLKKWGCHWFTSKGPTKIIWE